MATGGQDTRYDDESLARVDVLDMSAAVSVGSALILSEVTATAAPSSPKTRETVVEVGSQRC